tara:strand:+ start:611 stop:937 length:327 start_codon:yes stop_codon:yes gene_type:complete
MAQSKVKVVELQGSGSAKEPLGKKDVDAFLAANPKARIVLTGGPLPLSREGTQRAAIFSVMAEWSGTAKEFTSDDKVHRVWKGGMGDLLIALNGKKKNGFAPYIKLVG